MKRFARLGIVLMASVASMPSFAQNAPAASTSDEAGSGIEEIIVTAQRRGENLQKVPISITAVTAQALQASGITTTADIGRVTPGFQFQQAIGLAAPYIRGIGSAGQQAGYETSVATYVDGVYMAGGASALTTLNNVERIEVLKGPQGTLFGRNASGGLVHIITRDPKYAAEVQGSLTYDQWETVTATAYATGGLTDGIAADLAVRYSTQGQGWGRNRTTNEEVNKVDHDFAIRSKLLLDLNDANTLKIAGDYSDTLASTFVTFSPVPGHLMSGGYLFTGRAWDSVSTVQNPFRHSKAWGVSADWVSKFDFASLHSITAYRDSKFTAGFDPGALPVPTVTIGSLVKQKQFSQELQLLSNDSSAFKWIAGLYYFHGSSGGSQNNVQLYPALTFAPGEIDSFQQGSNKVDSYAAYAQATFPVSDRLNLTAGARYTRDTYSYRNITTTNLTFVPPQFGGITTVTYPVRRGSASKPSWRIAADYRLAEGALIFASYNRGFKSGGYDVQAETGPELKPEIIDAFEVGTKIDAFDRKVRLNATAFYQEVKNLQLVVYFNGVSNIRNAASAHAYGAEVELTIAPTKGLTLTATGNYLHSRFDDFRGNAPITTPLPGGGNNINPNGDASGFQTPRAPDKTLTLAANYETAFADGKLGLNASWFRSAKWYSDPDLRLFQPAYSLVAGEVSWTEPSDHIRFRIFVHNLTNSKVTAQFGELANGDVRSLNAPRTVGGGIDFKF